MNPYLATGLRIFGYFVFFVILLLVLPTPVSVLFATLVIVGFEDFRRRRWQHATRTFNEMVGSIQRHDGRIENVVAAFSRSGPLKNQCRQYLYRLRAGQDPVHAAEASGVPLFFSTAIALRTIRRPAGDAAQTKRNSDDRWVQHSDELSDIDANDIPAYGQFIYLIVVALMVYLCLTFLTLFITPTIEKMLEEFGREFDGSRLLLRNFASGWVLVGLLVVCGVIVPALSRGRIFGLRLPQWIPMLPHRANRKAEVLNGFADAIDSGMPMDQAVRVGHSIARWASQRSEMHQAFVRLEFGNSIAAVMQQAKWLTPTEAKWIEGSPPDRMSELLRSIADQNVRNANANSRWLLGIFFPVVIVLLGLLVLAYGIGLFASLSEIIYGID
ncbi:membrane protein [Rhodopirellula maiorica SM1]|uniref:Membrane protein n=1 Tax=Rhodopirellula maiorica SM1 TaxID=1265738 RepID=M5RB98_9BACT|nr:type II secretion system F family protein [Rhodopirellula maiorica]EMI16316.1 membrane protein [Rhodopirellula maiorica SM1]